MSELVLADNRVRARMPRRSPRALAPDDTPIPGRFDLWLSMLYARLRTAIQARRPPPRSSADAVAAALAPLRSLDETGFQRELAAFRSAATPGRMLESADTRARALAFAAAAAEGTLSMSPYPEQFMGALAMLNGELAEMATGEGKSLTAAITAAAAALCGETVQIVTVNDYLAARDAVRHGPMFERLGLAVDCVHAEQPNARRREAYRADVVYCTNKDIVFDYLRDRVASGAWRSLRRRTAQTLLGDGGTPEPLVPALRYAIVDEADSVLIDEARTPLIISRPGEEAHATIYDEAIALAGRLEAAEHWCMDIHDRHIALTEAGRSRLERNSREAGSVWRSERMREYLVVQALNAVHAYVRDRDYIVKDGKVQIVDEYTGRVLSDRSWERGLHQMVEAKESLEITAARESVARMTYQRFFRRYQRLAGMTGTGLEVAGEMWAVYGLRVRPVPTHLPVQRLALGTRVFLHAEARARALVERTRATIAAGRCVLIGTRSVRMSEAVAGWLGDAGVEHVVLNARQDADEAAIVAAAGRRGKVTVATNMAGRGTDILLDPEVRAAGGLHVIMTEYHDSARIDRQLIGRGARQGDPGSWEALVCTDDELFTQFAAPLVAVMKRVWRDRECLPRAAAMLLHRVAQARAQRLHAGVRMRTLQQDYRTRQMMGFAGRAE